MAARFTPGDARSRRSLIRAGLAGLAGLALGALGRPSRADAAAGGSLVMGQSNDAGTTNTSLTTSTNTGTALLVTQNGTATALRGVAGKGIAGFFTSANGSGISGVVANKDRYGVYGGNDATTTGFGAAIRANGKQNHGLVATTDHNFSYAIKAENNSPDWGYEGTAIHSNGKLNRAVTATTDAMDEPAIWAENTLGSLNPGTAIRAFSAAGSVYAVDEAGAYPGAIEAAGYCGVVGATSYNVMDSFGVVGVTRGAVYAGGVQGIARAESGVAWGVQGLNWTAAANSAAVGGWAYAAGGTAVLGWARATSGVSIGVYGMTSSASGYGVFSQGAAYVAGPLTVTGLAAGPASAMVIDHPVDPATKLLYHSGVVSPDMLTVYSGIATMDYWGNATVSVPAWFEALNKDIRYQLTPLDEASTPYVSSRLSGGHFSISGGTDSQQICWLLTGVRKDAWADANRIPVEVTKTAGTAGTYLHPKEAGQPETKSYSRTLRSPDVEGAAAHSSRRGKSPKS